MAKKISWQQKMKNRIKELEKEKTILIETPTSIRAIEIKASHKIFKEFEESLWYGSPYLKT